MNDINAVFRKEWWEIFRHAEGPFSNAVWLAVFLIGFAIYIGFTSPDSTLILLTGSVGFAMIVASPVVADMFAGERERRTLETLLSSRLPTRAILLGKVGALTAYGWLYSVLYLVALLATVWLRGGGGVLARPFAVAAAFVLAPLAISLFALVGGLISLRSPTVKQAQQTLGTIMIGAIVAMVLAMTGFAAIIGFGGGPPPDWLASSFVRVTAAVSDARPLTLLLAAVAVLTVANAIVLALALRGFERGRLALS